MIVCELTVLRRREVNAELPSRGDILKGQEGWRGARAPSVEVK